MPAIDDPQLAQIFRAESEERLARLDSGLLLLERTPGDRALIDDLFRETHSLKGAARMLGLMQVEGTAHDLETLLNAALKAGTALGAADLEALDRGLKKLHREIRAVLADGGDKPSPPPERSPPPAAAQEPEAAAAGPPPPPEPAARAFHIDTVRVETDKLDELLTLAGELGVLRGRAQHRQAAMAEIQEQWSAMERACNSLLAALPRGDGALLRRAQAQETTLARLGDLLAAAREGLQEDTARFEATLSRLQEQIHTARLLPLAVVFNLFPRMVRDLAKEQGKEVELRLEGTDLTLDKRILEEIKDPLMHLLRNAVGHGIEPPAVRLALDKPPAGLIRVAARRSGPNVVLEVEDDGRGLDLEAIRRTAVQRGIADADAVAGMADEQLWQLIFTPGFSTAFEVTELSGRGVGMDVVAANIGRLKGSIALDSRPGRGTTLRLTLPLSLTTLRLLVVRAGGQTFGLPMESIHRLLFLPRTALYLLEGRPAADLEGQPVSAPALAEILGLPGAPMAEGDGPLPCAVVRSESQLLALLLDEVQAEEEVVPRPLPTPLRRVPNLASLATLANGDICPILDVADLLRSAARVSARPPLAPAPQPAATRTCILLVEDSALVRAMEKRIIEDAGYEVVTAVDGADALEKLPTRPFAAVVSDIQMPNMDGLALTARLRGDDRFRSLPVILVSALDSDGDRRRGLQVGASAYIPKPSFDQRLLVDTLRRLVLP